MVEIFITDSQKKYGQSKHRDKILYLNGFITQCSFISETEISDFNYTLVGIEDEANRLMLHDLDHDVSRIMEMGIDIPANRIINTLPPEQKTISLLFNFYKNFVVGKYLFMLVLERFFTRFSIPQRPLALHLSQDLYLTQQSKFNIKSASYYRTYNNLYLKAIFRQAYYFFHRLFLNAKDPAKTQVAIFLYDIHNEFDLFKGYMELAKKENKLDITIVVVDSGIPMDKRVNSSMYEGGNVKVVHVYERKVNMLSDYSRFYAICAKINPLYKVFKNARSCEQEDVQYGFTSNVLSKLSPDICLYTNIQEYGRVVANVCAHYNIPSLCVEYAFAFDTYIMEKRIKFDARACISEITAQNWIKHKDPTPRHEIVGFCKIDDWHEKLAIREKSASQRPFDNDKTTILFVSTWAPNPNSPLLIEKSIIVKQLSEICLRNDWNLIVKKHPSEFDNFVDEVFIKNKYSNQKIVEHNQMSLFDCVYYSDFVCTQNSSAFIETLYLNKPFSYISATGTNLWANMSYFAKEKDVKTFDSVEEYEQYLMSNSGSDSYQKLQDAFAKLQSKFLYKTDSRASERLLRLTESFVKQKI
jgi:hypothetical protein